MIHNTTSGSCMNIMMGLDGGIHVCKVLVIGRGMKDSNVESYIQ